MPKTILISMGDPAGIGSEVAVRALANFDAPDTRIVAIGDADIMLRACEVLGIDSPFSVVGTDDYFESGPTRCFLDCKSISTNEAPFGQGSVATGRAAMQYLTAAVSFLNSKKADGLVTAPIHKGFVNEAGWLIQGHTEWLGEQTASTPTMMLVGDKLRVALVTTHVALKEVSTLLSRKKIIETTQAVDTALTKSFNIPEPKIAVLAFNPHAGEGGLFGQEEELISAAVDELKAMNIDATGPVVADTAFYKAIQGEFDAEICMYHDQGLIPLKMLAFDTGVNVTLGLPFPRTSPDHGTAFDIAGQGTASHASMLQALKLCSQLAG